jgi:hypothetical protein
LEGGAYYQMIIKRNKQNIQSKQHSTNMTKSDGFNSFIVESEELGG